MTRAMTGGSSTPIDPSVQMKTVTEFPRAVREFENLWIPLADGTRLAARLWMPEDAEEAPVPAILEYLPYRKRDSTAARDELTHPYVAGHGYACIRVDLRGSGESDGLLWGEYLEQEHDDALEVIAWIARQRWWDQWLKGVETGVMRDPMMRAWMQESVRPAGWYGVRPGRWIAEAQWPPAALDMRPHYLTADGLAASSGTRTPMMLNSVETVGLLSGSWSVQGVTPDEPVDQREEDGKSLVFDSVPLAERVEVLGAPLLEIDIASDKPNGKLAVRLCDVHPDGASTRVSYGILNLTHRDSHECPTALEPGRWYRVRIRLKETGYAFPPGHRLRVALSTTYWPMTWPLPERATLTIAAGESCLTLPVRTPRAEDADLPPFEAAESAAPQSCTVLRPGGFERTVTRDLGSNQTTAVMADDYGTTRLEGCGIEMTSSRRHEFSIADEDPLSARAATDWTMDVGRGDWRTRAVVRVVQTATRDSFHLRAQLDAFEGEARVVSRNWHYTVPRDLV
jgi:uncharacterized protein